MQWMSGWSQVAGTMHQLALSEKNNETNNDTGADVIPLSQLCGLGRGFLRSKQIFFVCRRLRFVLPKVAERFTFSMRSKGSFTVFAVYLRFPAVLCGCSTAENRGLTAEI